MAQVASFQVPAHPSGLEMRTQLNQIVLALVSANSGPVAPVQTFPLMWWGDTTANRLRIRNTANDAWTDLGPIDDFLADIRTLVTTTAAQKVNRSGDYMTGSLIMRNTNLFFQNAASQNFGYFGAFGTAGAVGSGLGIVDSSLTLWNIQFDNFGNVFVRGNGTINGGLRVDGGRLQLRQAGLYGEVAMYSTNGTVMFMRGRTVEGGGMQWVNNDYNAICADMDNNGNMRLLGQLAVGNGASTLASNGDLVGSVWGNAWLSQFIAARVGERAPIGAMVHHNSGIAESSQWAAGADNVVDMGDPWVVQGIRTTSGVGWSWLRCVWLRNA